MGENEAPHTRKRDGENREADAPVLRDANGRFMPGTASGPGRPPLVAIRDRLSKTLERHVKDEDAVAAYDTLVKHVKRGNLRAAIEYLRIFGGVAEEKISQHATAVGIKIVVGVDEAKL